MKLVKILVAVALIFASSAVSSLQLMPYVGIDTHWRLMNSNSKSRSGLFGSQAPQPLFYAGVNVDDMVLLEIGNFTYNHKKSNHKHKVKGTCFTATYRASVFQDQNAALLAGIGLTSMTKKDAVTDTTNEYSKDPNSVSTKLSNTIPRLSAGLEYKLTDHVALRGLVIWENASFYKKSSVALTDSNRVGDDYSMTFGLNYTF